MDQPNDHGKIQRYFLAIRGVRVISSDMHGLFVEVEATSPFNPHAFIEMGVEICVVSSDDQRSYVGGKINPRDSVSASEARETIQVCSRRPVLRSSHHGRHGSERHNLLFVFEKREEAARVIVYPVSTRQGLQKRSNVESVKFLPVGEEPWIIANSAFARTEKA